MRWLIMLLVLLPVEAWALKVNRKDARKVYSLAEGSVLSGTVTVRSVFIGEPVGTPVQISVKFACAAGFRTSDAANVESWLVYDYGHSKRPSELATFDPVTRQITVYYWDSRMYDGDVGRGESAKRTISTAGACVRT